MQVFVISDQVPLMILMTGGPAFQRRPEWAATEVGRRDRKVRRVSICGSKVNGPAHSSIVPAGEFREPQATASTRA
ncbi:hypothetical protein AB0B66_38315 [Catellatospora sp. NPDC049111]|uniref:hypothetical protein n=1 Tax=Catellatospora sp. NPDC049111 TaxID=3155271 RepID=UPI0033FF9FB4